MANKTVNKAARRSDAVSTLLQQIDWSTTRTIRSNLIGTAVTTAADRRKSDRAPSVATRHAQRLTVTRAINVISHASGLPTETVEQVFGVSKSDSNATGRLETAALRVWKRRMTVAERERFAASITR